MLWLTLLTRALLGRVEASKQSAEGKKHVKTEGKYHSKQETLCRQSKCYIRRHGPVDR